MQEKKILIIHPKDKTTSFLDKIKNHLIESFKEDVHHFNIQPNDKSHSECLERISSHTENGIIIFLGHGRTNKLYGSKGNLYRNAEFVSVEAKEENPDDYYYNDNFINQENASVFSGKKVFCLACNSNNKIAEYAIENGARTFLGFGDIPTSIEEFRDDGLENVSNDIVKAMKTELNYIVKRSIEYGISNSYNFEQLQNIAHFLINQKISEYLITRKDYKERYILTDYLYQLKKGIIVFGDKNIKLIE